MIVRVCVRAHHLSSNAGTGIGNLISCGIPHSPPASELLNSPGLYIHGACVQYKLKSSISDLTENIC